jgi:hypothetical protein
VHGNAKVTNKSELFLKCSSFEKTIAFLQHSPHHIADQPRVTSEFLWVATSSPTNSIRNAIFLNLHLVTEMQLADSSMKREQNFQLMRHNPRHLAARRRLINGPR